MTQRPRQDGESQDDYNKRVNQGQPKPNQNPNANKDTNENKAEQ